MSYDIETSCEDFISMNKEFWPDSAKKTLNNCEDRFTLKKFLDDFRASKSLMYLGLMQSLSHQMF